MCIRDRDGSISYVENTTPISSANMQAGNPGTFWGNGGFDMGSYSLIDKSYIKLRSIALSWDLPNNWLTNTPFQAVRLSAFGNNFIHRIRDNHRITIVVRCSNSITCKIVNIFSTRIHHTPVTHI